MGRLGGLIPTPHRGGMIPPVRPRVRITVPDPNAPRLPGDVPPVDDVPTRVPDDSVPPRLPEEAPRDPWKGPQDDVNLPWYRNPNNIVPGAMAAGLGGLAWLVARGLSGTGGTADLAEESRPLPEGPDLNDPAVRSRLSRSVEGRAALGSRQAQRYLRQQDFARDIWRAKAFLAGGSHNLNSGNSGLYNQFLALNPPGELEDYELNDEQRAIVQQNMPINPYRAKVEEAQLNRAAELAGKMVARQLENSVPDPVKAEAVLQQQQDRQRSNYAAALKHIEENYAWSPDSWFGSDFTDAEVQSAIDDIATMLRIPEAEAAAIVNSIANTYRARGR